ncbi:MAG: hypothetical protein ACI9AT_002131 [Ulvibacter sp.]|jgi:hypothetical protein
MFIMKKIILLNFLALFFTVSFSQAQDIINPVSASATAADFGTSAMDIINGEGLTSFPSTSASHATSSVGNSLQYFNGVNVIDFDLGGTFDIEGFAYWNGTSDVTSYGVKDVNITSSLDGVNFTSIPGAPTEFAESTLPPNLAEMYSFDALSATYIRFEALTNHGNFLLTILSEVAFIGTAPATENVINPVSASTTLTAQFGSSLDNTINGAGLDVFPSLSGTHGMTTPNDTYYATLETGSIDFDLGGSYLVDGLALWNANAPGPGATGIQGVLISSSTDGVTYTPIADAPDTFSQVMGATSPAEQFSFGEVTASYIRFDVLSNYGDPGNLVAFAEVAFSGVPAPLSVTEVNLSNLIAVYPNPALDYVRINNNSTLEIEGISIYDMNGRLLRQVIKTNSFNDRINLSDLPAGLYILHIYGDNLSTMKKVIKK